MISKERVEVVFKKEKLEIIYLFKYLAEALKIRGNGGEI